MKILYALPRHNRQLQSLQRAVNDPQMAGLKYICVVVDGPESLDRRSSWASSFNDEDTHKLFVALAEQTKP